MNVEPVTTTEQRTTAPTAFPVDDAELASIFEHAVRDAGAAQTLATEAEQRAAAAADAFCSDPTPEANGLAETEKQRAKNALKHARLEADRAAVLGKEHRRRQGLARVQELEPAVSHERVTAQAMDEVQALAADLHARVAQTVKRLVELIATQSAAASEAGRLSYELGQLRNDLQPLDLAKVNEWLSTRVPAAFPPRRLDFGRRGPAPFTVDFAGSGDGSVLVRIAAATYVLPREHGHSVTDYLDLHSERDRERHRPTLAWDPDAGEFCVRRS